MANTYRIYIKGRDQTAAVEASNVSERSNEIQFIDIEGNVVAQFQKENLDGYRLVKPSGN